MDHGNEIDAAPGSHWPVRNRGRLLEPAADAERRLVRQCLDALAERRFLVLEWVFVIQQFLVELILGRWRIGWRLFEQQLVQRRAAFAIRRKRRGERLSGQLGVDPIAESLAERLVVPVAV